MKLYKIPWTTNNNPNGWIEPTTHCQLKCLNCYRGLEDDNRERVHRNVGEIKNEIDMHILKRNVQTISIAGGEPLMHPEIEEMVKYINSKGLKSKIYTNGIMLDEKKADLLKRAGTTEIIIHANPFEKGFSEKWGKYCDMFRKMGMNLGLIMPIHNKNKESVEVVREIAQKNSDVINLVVFVVLKEMLPGRELNEEYGLSLEETKKIVKEKFGLEYCAYLGKEKSEKESWVFSVSLYNKGMLLGSFDAEIYQKLQERYLKKKGKYFITAPNKSLSKIKLMPWIKNPGVKLIYDKVSLGEKINHQVVLLIDPPDKNERGWDLCDGCPDAMLHENKLVPSCLLERIRDGEKIQIPDN